MAYEFFYHYLYPLVEEGSFSFLRLFQYITFRSTYAAISAFLSFLFLAPFFILYLQQNQWTQPIREDGPQNHFIKAHTPTMGGLFIVFIILCNTLFWARLNFEFIWLALFCLTSFAAIGFIDDAKKLKHQNSHGLSIRAKLFWQSTCAFILMLALSQVIFWEFLQRNLPLSVLQLIHQSAQPDMALLYPYFQDTFIFPLYIPFLNQPLLDLLYGAFFFYVPFFNFPVCFPIVYIFFGIWILLCSSNAVNLTDGLDGLAIGLCIFVGLTFSVIAYVSGNVQATDYLQIVYVFQAGELTVFCTTLAGASLGFLWFNGHPSQIFMGDSGSLALGSIIGFIALMLKKEILLILIGGIFVVEALSVIIQVIYFKCTKKRFFKMAPLHHHFEIKGLHESKVIIRFWIIGAILSLLALSTLKIQ